jgi:hypothetical protein
MKKSYIVFSVAALLLTACKPNIEADAPSANGLDLSRYVSVGNSLTAGSADGSLYKSGQMYSYSAILAEQFKTVGGGEFKQPLLPGESGWPINPAFGLLPRFALQMVTNCMGTTLTPVPIAPPYDTAGSSNNIAAQGPFNNVGVPGIRAVDFLAPGYAFANPYAGRFFANPFGRPLDEATRLSATFFTVWIGADDVLGYARSGGAGGGPGGTYNISNFDTFRVSYDSVVSAMTRNGAKGALINIPDVATLPFFNTIPARGLPLTAGFADSLNAFYGQFGIPITFSQGMDYFVTEDATAPGGVRKLKEGELILITIPQDSICAGWGSYKPIPSNYVLTTSELTAISLATTNFNAFILAEATHYNLAHVDMRSYMQMLTTGIKFNGADYSSNLQTGASYSLDGLHMAPKGNALIANEILRTINAKYGSSIPATDVNKYPGTRLP